MPKITSKPSKSTKRGPTIGQTVGHGMASGFGIGAGLEASRAVIGGLFGSKEENVNNEVPSNKEVCKFEKDQLEACLNKDMDCKDLMELLNNCYKSNK